MKKLSKLLFLFLATLYIQSSYSQTTYTVTSSSLSGPGSFLAAIDSANANPGADIIEFTANLQVDASVSNVGPSNSVMALITESVIIDGMGGALNGRQTWINSSGAQNVSTACPGDVASTIQLAYMPGFLSVGTLGQDNTGIEVTVKNLTIRQFNQVAKVNTNASLVMENFIAFDTWSTYGCFGDQMIDGAEGSSISLKNCKFLNAENWSIPGFAASVAVGPNAGDLTIERCLFVQLNSGVQPSIYYGGAAESELNIVSSRFLRSGGFDIVGDGQTNIVNSIWSNYYLGVPGKGDQIINASSGDMNIIASSLIWNTNECDNSCQANNLSSLITIDGAGNINFSESAVGLNFDASDGAVQLNTLGIRGTGSYTADTYTWIQPTTLQNAVALQTITSQPALLTNSSALNSPVLATTADFDIEMATPASQGTLIDVIPSGNPLINPITGFPIAFDAAGNERTDANGRRDIGAIQLAIAPFISILDVNDQSVDLSWNEPLHHNNLTILRHELSYVETSGGTPSVVIVDLPNLTKTINGLINGTKYEFKVRAIYDDNGTEEAGPYSNIVFGTPYGFLDHPVLSAIPGNQEVELSWNLPSLGGRTFESYVLLWKINGNTDYLDGNVILDPNQTSTTITGLTNETEYEFSLAVITTNNDRSDYGIDTATPSDALSIEELTKENIVFYPNPVNDILQIKLQSTDINIQLYSVSGRLLKEIRNVKRIDLSDLSTGVYFLKMSSKNKVYSGKLIKN